MKKENMSGAKGVKQNRLHEFWKQYRRNKGAVFGLIVLVLILLVAIFADFIWDYDTQIVGTDVMNRLVKPCWEHPLGTDNYGRDMLARIGYGTRYSVLLGVAAVCIAAVIGIPIGATAGYVGGKADSIIMRCVDIFATIPTMMMAILLVTVLGNSLSALAVALSVGSIPVMVRITRSSVMMVRNNEYIEAARAIGAPTHKIIMKHILPNCFSPILVNSTLRVGITITATAGLSYVGLGVPLPLPEWGALLTSSKSYLLDAPHMLIYPGVALIITVMMINLVGDGVRVALDPKLKR